MNSSFSMFEEGKLSKAIEAALSAVREDPGSVDRRLELISYLCFNNLFEKADTHIIVLMEQHADLVADMLVYRALIKAELARRQCFEEGRLPNFAEPPPPAITEVLRALTEIKDSPQNAATILRGAIAQAPPIKVIIDETTHSYFGDVDERMALFIEAFTLGGDYYWLPLTSLRKIELVKPNSRSKSSGGKQASSQAPMMKSLAMCQVSIQEPIRAGKSFAAW